MTNKEEMELISKIVDRGWPTMKRYYKERIDMTIDIEKAHECCSLKLQKLLQADSFNFLHDLTGIWQNMNRTTGKLENCFLPRFAEKQG